jgi:hypothetical protein
VILNLQKTETNGQQKGENIVQKLMELRLKSLMDLRLMGLHVFLLLVLGTSTVLAQAQGINEADMQKMMQQAQKMQACMANVDRSKLKELENRGRQLEAEINELCAAGKRDEALSKAMREGLKLSNDPAVKAMRECATLMPDMSSMMPSIPYIGTNDGNDKDKSGGHICD